MAADGETEPHTTIAPNQPVLPAAYSSNDGQGTPEKSDAADPNAAGDVGSASDASTGDRALGATQAGEAAADSTSQEAESGIDAGASDSGGLPCGDASCGPTEICLYPAYGCAAGSGRCPPPSCVSPPAGAGSYDCSPGGVETPACGTGPWDGCDVRLFSSSWREAKGSS